jgi:hypothetical protein
LTCEGGDTGGAARHPAVIAEYAGGLSASEVTERKARSEVNVPPPAPGRSYRQIFFENVFSFISNVFYCLPVFDLAADSRVTI